MQVLLHKIPKKYLDRLNEPDQGHVDRSLSAIKPLLFFLANDYWKPTIEVASPKEIEMINERMKDYETDPSSFVPL